MATRGITTATAMVPLSPRPDDPPPSLSPALKVEGVEEVELADDVVSAVVGSLVGVKVDVSTIT